MTRTPNPALLDAAFAAVADGVAGGTLPSAVLAVANRNEIIRMDAFGPATVDSIFLLASITKPIFSTAVMQLVERGKVLLNDRIVRLIPEFAVNNKGDVRLWNLLTHTSGLVGTAGSELWGRANRDQMRAAILGAGLEFKPGTEFSYNNPAFGVMSELIQRVSSQDDVSFLRDNVLAPLGMVDTSYRPTDESRAMPVHNAPWSDDASREYWMNLAIPAGGLWSTAGDLVRFGQAMLGGKTASGKQVLSPATISQMSRLQTDGLYSTNGDGKARAYYGLGYFKAGFTNSGGPSPEYRTAAGYGHPGASGTLLWIEPELDLIYLFLTNSWGSANPQQHLALNATIAAFSGQ